TYTLVNIAGYIYMFQLLIPSDDVLMDSPSLEIRNGKGGTSLFPGETEWLFFRRFSLFPVAGSCITGNSRGTTAYQMFHSLYKAIPSDFHKVVHGVDASSTAVPVPVILACHITHAVMLLMAI